ncbi:MAG: DUF3576 domain-containing protein [Gemmobacter sp.]
MSFKSLARVFLLCGLVVGLSGCGGGLGSLNPFGGRSAERAPAAPVSLEDQQRRELAARPLSREEMAERQRGAASATAPRESLWDLFRGRGGDAELNMNVNRYLWNASLDVLNFLPPETVDPFSGVIATGYGTPPGGGRAYRATVYISDPALDARSLRVAMQTRGGGPVSAETVRAVEDAILTRARQLRVRDGRL